MEPDRPLVRQMKMVIGPLIFLFLVVGLVVPTTHRCGGPQMWKMQCANNLKQVALAAIGFAEAHGDEFPRGERLDGMTPERGMSWICRCQPLLDEVDRDRACDRSVPWDVPPNVQIAAQHFSILYCPASDKLVTPKGFSATCYVGIAGVGADAPYLEAGHPRAGVFGYTRVTRTSDIKDGLSQTILVAETDFEPGPWMSGGRSTIRSVVPTQRPYLGKGRPFGGNHKPGFGNWISGENHGDGGYVAFADGSVRFVREAIHPEVFEAMATIAGGEALPDDIE
jgi:prepilin-type processing-associated H-X9-DG protein